jgi:phosphoserine phosphatase RsbU/P
MEKNTPSSCILLVDDDRGTLRLMATLLERDGFKVECANDGNEGLEKVIELRPDLVIMDVVMPGLDGFQLCHRIKNTPTLNLIPVILATSLDRSADKVQGIEAGADDFITKPINAAEMRARVKSLLKMARLHRMVEKQNIELKRELDMAQLLQEELLPSRHTNLGPLSIAALYKPAVTVSGDIYDYFEIRPGVYGVFIADVMGHGIAAALLTMMIKCTIQDIVRNQYIQSKELDPALLMGHLNRRLYSNFPYRIVTAIFAIYDEDKGLMHFCNAGNASPLILSPDREEPEWIEEPHNLVLSANGDVEYKSTSRPFAEGERLFLFTDGVYEVRNSEGVLFGLEAMSRSLKCVMDQPPKRALATLFLEVCEYSVREHPMDDINVVAVELGSPSSEDHS